MYSHVPQTYASFSSNREPDHVAHIAGIHLFRHKHKLGYSLRMRVCVCVCARMDVVPCTTMPSEMVCRRSDADALFLRNSFTVRRTLFHLMCAILRKLNIFYVSSGRTDVVDDETRRRCRIVVVVVVVAIEHTAISFVGTLNECSVYTQHSWPPLGSLHQMQSDEANKCQCTNRIL